MLSLYNGVIMNEINCYETDDGRIFKTIELASEHEDFLKKQAQRKFERAIELERYKIDKEKSFNIYLELKAELLQYEPIQRNLKRKACKLQKEYSLGRLSLTLKTLTVTLYQIDMNKRAIYPIQNRMHELNSKWNKSFYSKRYSKRYVR